MKEILHSNIFHGQKCKLSQQNPNSYNPTVHGNNLCISVKLCLFQAWKVVSTFASQ
jgi:hypothetical protein